MPVETVASGQWPVTIHYPLFTVHESVSCALLALVVGIDENVAEQRGENRWETACIRHEDFKLAAGRGMPAPFDNGVMRFAWVAPLITNWLGDDGFLKRLKVQVRRPGMYGDLATYSGKVVAKEQGRIKLAIDGKKQDGSIHTSGEAEVVLPRQAS
jgi:hypothetical protein